MRPRRPAWPKSAAWENLTRLRFKMCLPNKPRFKLNSCQIFAMDDLSDTSTQGDDGASRVASSSGWHTVVVYLDLKGFG